VLVLVVVLSATPAAADGIARYRISGDVLPESHAASGFYQSVVHEEAGVVTVRVEIPAVPVGTGGRGFVAARPGWVAAPPEFELPRGLSRQLKRGLDAYSRATAVLQWVSRSVQHDPEDLGPQDAGAVLRRGRGRCSGLANVATALLIEAGFKARTVSGLLVADGAVTPHRWLECQLPGAGWVATDPTIGFWVMTPSHVAFAQTVMSVPHVEVLAGGESVKGLPWLDGRPIRPDRGSQLVCRIVNERTGAELVAVLSAGSGDERRAVLDPEAEFSKLLPGDWQLVILDERRVVARRTLVLGPATAHSVVVDVRSSESS